MAILVLILFIFVVLIRVAIGCLKDFIAWIRNKTRQKNKKSSTEILTDNDILTFEELLEDEEED